VHFGGGCYSCRGLVEVCREVGVFPVVVGAIVVAQACTEGPVGASMLSEVYAEGQLEGDPEECRVAWYPWEYALC
jgi:hypothetical protein